MNWILFDSCVRRLSDKQISDPRLIRYRKTRSSQSADLEVVDLKLSPHTDSFAVRAHTTGASFGIHLFTGLYRTDETAAHRT